MNRKTAHPGRKLTGVLIGAYLTAFAVFLIAAIISFPGSGILQSFRGGWIFTRTAALFITFFIPVQCAAILVVHALFPGYMRNTSGKFSSYIILFVSLMIVYTLGSEIAYPKLMQVQNGYRYQTETAQEFAKAAMEAKSEGNYDLGVQHLEKYAALDPNNQRMEQELSKMKREAAARRNRGGTAQENVEETGKMIREMTGEEMYAVAEEFLEKEDFSSAYYYAALALKLGFDEAREIREAAWKRLQSPLPEPEYRERSALFEEKSEGRTALTMGNPLEAYYLFTRLKEQFPEDPEIAHYLSLSTEAIEDSVFFLDETLQVLIYPGYEGIFFSHTPEEGTEELYRIRRVVHAANGIYLQDFEMMTFRTEDRHILKHITAPYGKTTEGRILLRCVDRENEAIQFLPTVLIPEGETDAPGAVELPIEPEKLYLFSIEIEELPDQNFARLWELFRLWPDHGYRKEPVLIEMLMRLLYPFSFLIFSLFSLGIGLKARHRMVKLPAGAYLLIPLVPVLFYYIMQGFYYINRVFLGLMLLWSGGPLSLAALGAVQGALLLGSIAYAMSNFKK